MNIQDVATRLRGNIKKIKQIYGSTLETLCDYFVKGNYDLRIAGESVRDLLLDKMPLNIELITSATPSELTALFANERNCSIAIKYGDAKNYSIITVRVTKDRSYKIKIISSDETNETDDDSAKFATVWERDAYNRLFTVDAMFLDFNGKIYDYFNGYNDIVNATVRVAGDPDIRFKEDCMRILKYFRLFAVISNKNSVIDQETLNAIKGNLKGLENIKGELIWDEVKMILMQPMGGYSIEKFIECSGASYLGLPDNVNFDELREVIQKHEVIQKWEVSKKPKFPQFPLLGISYLCTFLQTQADVIKLHQRLRLSTYDRDLAKFLVNYKEKAKNIEDLVYYKQLCLLPLGANRHISKEYVLELLNYNRQEYLLDKLRKTVLPPFPINERMLHSNGCRIGSTDEVMGKLKDLWIQSKFKITFDELMKEVPVVLQQQNESEYEMAKKKPKIQ